MVMISDLVPGLKRFLSRTGMREAALRMATRMIVAFILHRGRMSCLQAAGALRAETLHRAQIGRMLKRRSFVRLDCDSVLQRQLLHSESEKGLFVFLIDATLCSQAGKKTENTYSTG